MSTRRLLITTVLLTLPACSAIVQPNTNRLGIDTGDSTFDAGVPLDTRLSPPDAIVTPDDTGPLTCTGGCNDGLACTTDRCVMGVCMPTPVDGDGDGQLAPECRGTDCNDSNGSIFRGAPEVCGDMIDNNCDTLVDEGCAPPDNCETARPVVLTEGRAEVSGDTSGLAADYRTPCLAMRPPQPDAVYRVEVPPGMDLKIDTTGSVDVVLAASQTCGSFESRQCNDDVTQSDRNARLWLHNTPGTWFILVTGFAAGPYTIRFAATPLATDRCRTGLLDITSGGTVIGLPTEMREAGSCGGERTPESAFIVNNNTFRSLTMYSAARSVLYLRSPDCSDGSEQVCETSTTTTSGGLQASIGADRWEAPLYIIAEGAAMTPYALNILP